MVRALDGRLGPPEAVRRCGEEGVGGPTRGVVDQDGHRTQLRFGGIEQCRCVGGVGEVGLQGHRAAARGPDGLGDVVRPRRPGRAVRRRKRRVSEAAELCVAEIGAQDRSALRGERLGRGGANAVVGSRDQSDPWHGRLAGRHCRVHVATCMRSMGTRSELDRPARRISEGRRGGRARLRPRRRSDGRSPRRGGAR